MAVMFQVEVFPVVTQCSAVVGYQRFGVPCCLYLQSEVMRWEEHVAVIGEMRVIKSREMR
jgi:hypothetical protein